MGIYHNFKVYLIPIDHLYVLDSSSKLVIQVYLLSSSLGLSDIYTYGGTLLNFYMNMIDLGTRGQL